MSPHPTPLFPRSITWRSCLLGFLCVILLCAITPYNDYVVASTILVGSYLPPILILTFFFLTVVVNAPLRRWRPQSALTSGELAVIMAMLLVGCALPSSGCMRMLIPLLIAPFSQTIGDQPAWAHFLSIHLPHWLFPVPAYGPYASDPRISPQVLWFITRTPADQQPPYGSWALPLLVWGIFFAAMFATLMALAALLRPQWISNERLPFPLAQLEFALVESPPPGRMFNDLLGSRVLWTGLLLAFTIQSLRALHMLLPHQWPDIPISFNLRPLLTEEPWSKLSIFSLQQTIYFTFVGIAFFIPARCAFSFWTVVLLCDQYAMLRQWRGNPAISPSAWQDQGLGASLSYAAAFLFIGRRYWAAAFRAAFHFFPTKLNPALSVPSIPSIPFISGANAKWPARIALLGAAAMIGWLVLVGVQLWVAACIVSFIILIHLVIARIVAETGLPFIRSYSSFSQIAINFPATIYRGCDVFFIGVMKILGTFSTRESVMTYSMHGLQVHQQATAPTDAPSIIPHGAKTAPSAPAPRPYHSGKLLSLMAASLLLGFVVSAASSLWCYYHYATPLTASIQTKINRIALEDWPRDEVMYPLKAHAAGSFTPKSYNPWRHIVAGAVITALLHFLTIGFRAWPFMPIGYLVQCTWYAQAAWFSIMLGWLSKVLIIRFGGVRMFTRAKPFFVGLIFGEALAAIVWLIVTLILAWTGHEYEQMSFLPT